MPPTLTPPPSSKRQLSALTKLSILLALLIVAFIAIAVMALLRTSQLVLPSTAEIAQYRKKKPDFGKPMRANNTFGKLDGCVFLAGRKQFVPTGDADIACEAQGASEWEGSSIDLARIVEGTAELRQRGSVTVKNEGQTAQQGSSVELTIDPVQQQLSQQLAECFTGKTELCAGLGVDSSHFSTFFEGAGARMAGVAVMDAATGRINAMTGANSECYKNDYSSVAPRKADCPPLPNAPAVIGYKLDNHAATQAPVASPIKALETLSILADQGIGGALRGSQQTVFAAKLAASQSEYFVDWMLCRDANFSGDCLRMARMKKMAEQLGWNSGDCEPIKNANGTQTIRRSCGAINLLWPLREHEQERPDVLPSQRSDGKYAVLGGRIMPTVTGRERFEAADAKRCSANEWKGCRHGGKLIDLMSEAFGQGNSIASPIGLAMLFANIANAANVAIAVNASANNSPRGASPALVQAHVLHTAKPLPLLASNPVPPKDAAFLMRILERVSQAGGSAYTACLRVNGQRPAACARKPSAAYAAKTGTPSFAHKGLTVWQRASLCAKPNITASELAMCRQIPYKWFVSAVKSKGTGDYDKIVVVLAERNFDRHTGRVDSPEDRGAPNVAAVLGIHLIQALYPATQP